MAFLKKIYFSLHWLGMPRDAVYCLLKGVKWQYTWRFNGLPLIRRRRGGVIEIGTHFTANSMFASNSLGVFQRCIVSAGAGANLRIGSHVGISGVTIHAAKSISIGDYVMIGSGALITDTDAHPLDPEQRRRGGCGVSRPVVIEDDVFIGARAIVLKGVRLGRGCVIGAGSVVVRDVPEYKIAAGNPAKVVGDVKKGVRAD